MRAFRHTDTRIPRLAIGTSKSRPFHVWGIWLPGLFLLRDGKIDTNPRHHVLVKGKGQR